MISWGIAHWPWLLLAWAFIVLFACCLAAASATRLPAAPPRRRDRPVRVLDDLGDELGGVVIQFPTDRARQHDDVVA